MLKRLGPGLLYAGAAVGVSHLVQSTRAGAAYGLVMVLVVILANVLKYPFFKAGPLFSASTGKSLLKAFHEEGRAAMLLFYLVTLSTVFSVQAVVTLITASVFASIFGLSFPLWQISAFFLIICATILLIGRYQLLDKLMRWVIILLAVATLITLFTAIGERAPEISLNSPFDFSNATDLFFLIALVGWMPAPLDISLWHSEWTLEEKQEKGGELSIKDAIFDFKIGYWGTTFLAAAFVALGALILANQEANLSASGAVFAGQIIDMYTQTLGRWTFAIIALAAFTTMFSTTLTVLDAYPRVLGKAWRLQFPNTASKQSTYLLALIFTVIGALFVLIFQLENMKQLVDFATTISFLTAPILASLIYYVSLKKAREIFTKVDHYLAWAGLIFLYFFSIYYLYSKYF